MDPRIYSVLPLVGILALFASLAAVATSDSAKLKKGSTILHGVAMLLILVAGFGLLAKLQLGFPGWVIVKLVIWLVFGALLVVSKRQLLRPGQLIGVMIALGALAAWLATFTPF